MKKFLKSLFVAMIAFLIVSSSAISACAEAKEQSRPQLKFNQDGKFKILMINDIQDTDKIVKDTINLITISLDKYKPDLVVLVGDNISYYWLGVNQKRVAKAIDNVVKPINDRNIPFAIVFGNHDQQTGVSKEKQMEMYRSYQNCLAVDEGDSLSNCGTYNLLIKDRTGEKNIFNIWMMDSGTSASGGGYQGVNADQIKWYEKTSQELKKENGGKPLPSLLFQHVPVPELYELFTKVPKETEGAVQGYRTQSNNYYILNSKIAQGNLLEAPCSADNNIGQFSSWKKCGDILGAYFGHDHVNDFKGNYQGIDLGYSPGAGFYHYGNGVFRGVRLFALDENNLKNYQSEVLYYKDLVSPIAGTTINDSTLSNDLRLYLPLALTAIILILLIALFAIATVRIIRRKKGKIEGNKKELTVV